MTDNKEKKTTKLGYVMESDDSSLELGGTPSPIIEVIVPKPAQTLMVSGRFDCPCCGKGIYFEINKEIDTNEQQ